MIQFDLLVKARLVRVLVYVIVLTHFELKVPLVISGNPHININHLALSVLCHNGPCCIYSTWGLIFFWPIPRVATNSTLTPVHFVLSLENSKFVKI